MAAAGLPQPDAWPASVLWDVLHARRLGGDPRAFVISRNLARRHLTESQRAMVAAKLANLDKGANQHSRASANLPTLLPDEPAVVASLSQSAAAEMLNVSDRSLRSARTVHESGVPELTAAVERGEVAVSAAAEVAKLPKDLQAEVVADGPAAVREVAKEVRANPEKVKMRETVLAAAKRGLSGGGRASTSNRNPLYVPPTEACCMSRSCCVEPPRLSGIPRNSLVFSCNMTRHKPAHSPASASPK